MKIFISWSGDLSKNVAEFLASWIEDVLQGIETWISSDDIDKGALWFGDINTQLSETKIGILCLTRENIDAPWILFEAGALSKGLSKNRVCPLLINLNHADLSPPLSQFNGTLPIKDDLLKLIRTINAENDEKALPEERLEKAFLRWWDDFDSKFNEIMKNYKPKKIVHQKSTEDMIEEILETTRSIQRTLQKSSSISSSSPISFRSQYGLTKSLGVLKLLDELGKESQKVEYNKEELEREIGEFLEKKFGKESQKVAYKKEEIEREIINFLLKKDMI